MIGYAVALRNAQLDAVTTFAGNAALLRIYDGTRPATAAAITSQTLLAELVLGSPLAAAAAAGVLTGNPVTSDPTANNSGTASWFRIVKADGTTFVVDGDAGESGTELTLVDSDLVAGNPVDLASLVVTRGNA